jgi:elongation factor Tu
MVMAKPHVNVWALGHAGHGKTTLTAALRARQAYRNNLPAFPTVHENTPTRSARVSLGPPTCVEYESDLLDLVEWEVRELLCQHDYPGDDVPFIRGNPRAVYETAGRDDNAARCIDELLGAMEEYLLVAERERNKPVRMTVEGALSIPDRGPAAHGRIEQGLLRPGEEIEIVGLRPVVQRARVVAIEAYQRELEVADPGLGVGVLLAEVTRADLERGMVLAAPGSIRAYTRFEAVVYVLRPEEGGRQSAFFSEYRPQFQFHGIDLGGRITLRGTDVGVPGEVVEITVELYAGLPVAMEVGSRFAIREGNRTVGVGTVTRLLG